MMLPQFYMDDLIRQAIREDINYIDTSADYLIPPDQMGKARFLAKADGVLCGLSVALRVFELLDPAIRAQRFHADGDTLQTVTLQSKKDSHESNPCHRHPYELGIFRTGGKDQDHGNAKNNHRRA